MSKDLISRQAAIDVIKKHYRSCDNGLLKVIAFRIKQLPSALGTDLAEVGTDCISRSVELQEGE